MRRSLIILLLLFPTTLWGQETSADRMAPARQSGGYLLKACTASALTPSGRLRRQYCAGFLAGVEETLRIVTPAEAALCPPGEVTARELASAYNRYMTASPESASQPAATTAAKALRKAFPCPSEHGE